jgi:hypothetical protein
MNDRASSLRLDRLPLPLDEYSLLIMPVFSFYYCPVIAANLLPFSFSSQKAGYRHWQGSSFFLSLSSHYFFTADANVLTSLKLLLPFSTS